MTVCRSAGMSPVAAPDCDEWIIFRGLSIRMLLIGPALLFALFLPAVEPYRWTAIALAVGLLTAVGGYLALQLFGPSYFRANLWLWVPNKMMANAAVALAVVGSNDPTGTFAFALPAIMMFQAGQRAWAAHRTSVTFSAGVAVAGGDDTNMLDRADAALYEAKAAGRNRTVLAA